MKRMSRAAGGPRATGRLVTCGAARALLGLIVAAAASLAIVGDASAAEGGALTFTPSGGRDDTPMYVVTSAPCPEPASNVVAVATGAGFPAAGQVVISNSTSGVSHRAPLVLPLQDTLHGFAAVNRTQLSGRYLVTLTCQNRLQTTAFATFTGAITFSSPQRFTAPGPSAAVRKAIAAASQPSSGSSPSDPAPSVPRPSPVSAAVSAPSTGSGGRIALTGVGAAVAAFGGLQIVRDRRRRPVPVSDKAPHQEEAQ